MLLLFELLPPDVEEGIMGGIMGMGVGIIMGMGGMGILGGIGGRGMLFINSWKAGLCIPGMPIGIDIPPGTGNGGRGGMGMSC